MADDSSGVLFISHNAVDRPYAAALAQLVASLAGHEGRVKVNFSSSAEHGPEGGEDWREWIHEQVQAARTTLLVITPHALGKPWLLWEAGAVKGAALMRAALPGAAPIIVSLAYGLRDSECPDPLRGEQIIQGTDTERLMPLFTEILQAHGLQGGELLKAGRRMDQAFRTYLAAVEQAARRAPSIVNEANVQDWLARLDRLQQEKRLSELGGFERWMMLAFGREASEADPASEVPIDLRLHRRLGELHLGQRQYVQARRHLRLAWRAAPRDIYVLRPLAEASMKLALEPGNAQAGADAAAQDETRALLDAIVELDPQAFIASADSAGLLAKYRRRVLKLPQEALQVYLAALEANPDSYYLADLAGQTQLELQQPEAARASFGRALDIIQRLGENSLWSHATAATALVGLARLDDAGRQLQALCAVQTPTSSQVDTIAGGIREVARHVGVEADRVDALLALLRKSS